jgi:hypothetical protein
LTYSGKKRESTYHLDKTYNEKTKKKTVERDKFNDWAPKEVAYMIMM